MQADEIIQQKEWHELDPTEKIVLEELAANEQEYNLLKKMLQVSSAEVEETPLINPRVKAVPMQEVKKSSSVFNKKYWYAAAAVLIGLAIAVMFILQKKPMPAYVKKDPLVKNMQQPLVIRETPVKKDSAVVIKKERQRIPVSHPKIIIPAEDLLVKDSSGFSSQDRYAVARATVGDEKELLSLVTEIY